MRLSKFLAQAGIASRRRAEELILSGQVKVNGERVAELGALITPGSDLVEYNGEIIAPERLIYLLLNKPAGFISSAYDPQGRPTVLNLLKGISERLYPVGRLDLDTEGLLLLTNDGHFNQLIIHPRYEIKKKYEAWVKGRVKEEEMAAFRKGMLLEDGLTAPAQASIIKREKEKTLLEVVLHEGRKRQVKRMCAAQGHPVIKLRRTSLAFLTLDGLNPGQYRHLQKTEVERLISLASSAEQDKKKPPGIFCDKIVE